MTTNEIKPNYELKLVDVLREFAREHGDPFGDDVTDEELLEIVKDLMSDPDFVEKCENSIKPRS